MNEHDLIVWSAVFARTNMGQVMPTAYEIGLYRVAASHGTSLEAMVNFVCADFCETDEHFDMFLDEAKSWRKELADKELEYIFTTWPKKKEVWL